MYISNNAYSGLNSLRGGLKHSYWSGSSLLDTTTFQSESGKPSCNYTISRNMQFGFQDTLSMDSNVFFIRWWGMYWYTYLFLFCFQYGFLKDTSQRLNFIRESNWCCRQFYWYIRYQRFFEYIKSLLGCYRTGMTWNIGRTYYQN